MINGAKDLYDFLQFVRNRPGMYFRDPSLEALETYCYGYHIACELHHIVEFAAFFRWHFNDYLALATGWPVGARNWASVICENTATPQEAWDRFFELLDGFRATYRPIVAELAKVDGPAEIVDGRVVTLHLHGDKDSTANLVILLSLRRHQRSGGTGYAHGANVGYLCNLPHRGSFCPDASWYTGPRNGMRFLTQPPVFAVETRWGLEYGEEHETRIAAKRADYFAAGTLVVWDIALLSDDVVRVYRHDAPQSPTIYRRGDIAEAEPAVPGWRIPVDELFD